MTASHTTDDQDGPCETGMMGVVHSALRRDLVRARLVLAGETPLADRRRVALAEPLMWLMDFLHHHHRNEDAGLYPMVVRNDPSTAELVGEMEADHQRIDPAVVALVSAAERLRDDAAAGPAVTAALDVLDAVLIPHLRREETEMMPVVATGVSQREFTQWDEEMNVGDKPMRQIVVQFAWRAWINLDRPPNDSPMEVWCWKERPPPCTFDVSAFASAIVTDFRAKMTAATRVILMSRSETDSTLCMGVPLVSGSPR